MTETEKMLAGKIYDASDSHLADRRIVAHRLSKQYNDTFEDEAEKRTAILKELIPNLGEDTYLQGPIQVDYGLYTTFGTRCYANFNFVVLDICPITIGNNVFFGPNCTLATPLHPYLPEERNLREKEDGTLYTLEYGAPIHIGDDCWLAANVTVCGGVTIGAGCIIGAGSVVTRDIPAGSLAAGQPVPGDSPDYRTGLDLFEETTLLNQKGFFMEANQTQTAAFAGLSLSAETIAELQTYLLAVANYYHILPIEKLYSILCEQNPGFSFERRFSLFLTGSENTTHLLPDFKAGRTV